MSVHLATFRVTRQVIAQQRQVRIPASVRAHLKPIHMKTKHSLLITSLIFLSTLLHGQLAVDAGSDTILCIGLYGFDSIVIGGNPTASGGSEPYLYSWSTNYTIGHLSFGASHFLNDTTLANPKLIDVAEKDIKFKVMVTDNNGIQNEDSIVFRSSRFAYLTIDNFASIKQGDTISLSNNIGLGIAPLSYIWTPNYHLSDTSICCPKAWPDTSVTYQVIAIDSIGCISAPDFFDVYVQTLGINTQKTGLYQSIIFPNPISYNSTITIDGYYNDELTISILNISGQVILTDKFLGDSYYIGDKILKSGIYLYLIKKDNNILSYGQFTKK